MIKDFLATFSGFLPKIETGKPASTVSEEEIELGGQAVVKKKWPERPTRERRSRSRCIQHTMHVYDDPNLYFDNGSCYVSEKDSNNTLSYEDALKLAALARPEIARDRGSQLALYTQMRSAGNSIQ